jgi:hypothetical protein
MVDMSCWPVLMTDGEPTPCTNWDNIGWGWVDLPGSDSQWPGDLLLYADAGCCSATGAREAVSASPAAGLRVFPNPATDAVTVSFALAEPATVDLAVYDVGGRRVADLHRGPSAAARSCSRGRPSAAAAFRHLLRAPRAGREESPARSC